MLIMDMAVQHSILSMLITVNKNPVCSVPDANSVHPVAAGDSADIQDCKSGLHSTEPGMLWRGGEKTYRFLL